MKKVTALLLVAAACGTSGDAASNDAVLSVGTSTTSTTQIESGESETLLAESAVEEAPASIPNEVAAPEQVAPDSVSVPEGSPSPSTPSGADAHYVWVSWYGTESGSRTANGEPFDGTSYTYASVTDPFGTIRTFCGPYGCVEARCNDRGPYVEGRSYDLSETTFAAIGPLSAGVMRVSVS